ncbi:outer membrane protein assembly factor BamE [Bacteroides sp.]|uniref:outer membrane protein assembly factor BamE n=1 Tax=Bacteroides sp. TaxID=29523 RepID=UPI0025BC511E|nr:outer membrane protein assembly factor BamE [Bacteroides sp.]
MKKIHTFGILLMIILFGSCITARVGFTNEQLLSVRKGMTLEQVTDVLGSPAYRSFDDKGEEWEFRTMVLSGWSVVTVRFVDGKVTEMKSYLEKDRDCHDRTDVTKKEKI